MWAQELEAQVKGLPRTALESFALEDYRYGTRMQVRGFLKQHGVYLNYTLEDLDRDIETSRGFSNR